MVMLINQVTNTRKIQTAHPSRALTVILILIEILVLLQPFKSIIV